MFRSKKWLQAVRDIEFCVLCGRYGVQAAHRNEGKGVGIKVDDSLLLRYVLIVIQELIMGEI